LAILPFYLQLIFSYFAFDARFLRILRVLRFLKGFHYSCSLQRLTKVAGKSKELLSSLIVVLSLLFVTSALSTKPKPTSLAALSNQCGEP
jgi:hypothetical protein